MTSASKAPNLLVRVALRSRTCWRRALEAFVGEDEEEEDLRGASLPGLAEEGIGGGTVFGLGGTLGRDWVLGFAALETVPGFC